MHASKRGQTLQQSILDTLLLDCVVFKDLPDVPASSAQVTYEQVWLSSERWEEGGP